MGTFTRRHKTTKDRSENADADSVDGVNRHGRIFGVLATLTLALVACDVMSSPLSVPIAGAPQAGSRERLVIQATGDVNLDPDYIESFRTEGYDHALGGLNGLFGTDDLTIINLECAASKLGSPEPKSFTFRCDSADALAQIRRDGVEVANLGNNHSGDYGKDALVDSRVQLDAAGIAPVGVGRNAAEASAPALFTINGWRVAVLGFGGVVPRPDWIATADRAGMADGDTIETMVAAVRAADEVADLVLVSIHWGRELDLRPVPEDVARAEAMIDAGADAIFGHHAHRLQPLETVDGAPVAWGLGNFVWPVLSQAGADTAVARVVFEPNGRVISCLLDATIVSDGHPVLDNPRATTCPGE